MILVQHIYNRNNYKKFLKKLKESEKLKGMQNESISRQFKH